MIRLTMVMVLMLGFAFNASAANSMRALNVCQSYLEIMATSSNYSVEFFKVKGASYQYSGNYAEFYMDLMGSLALIKCRVNNGSSITYLKMGDNLIVDKQ